MFFSGTIPVWAGEIVSSVILSPNGAQDYSTAQLRPLTFTWQLTQPYPILNTRMLLYQTLQLNDFTFVIYLGGTPTFGFALFF